MSEDDIGYDSFGSMERLGRYDGNDIQLIQVEDARTRTACMVESGHTDGDGNHDNDAMGISTSTTMTAMNAIVTADNSR